MNLNNMKIGKDPYDKYDDLTIKVCNLVRNMIYANYKEQNYDKAIRNAEELQIIVEEELQLYKDTKRKFELVKP